MADELVALLRQFSRLERLSVPDALLLLRPMEEAAAANIAGDLDAHAAVLHAVRERYVPAILQAQDAGMSPARILDGIAKSLGAGNVVDGHIPVFHRRAGCQPALADFVLGLTQETVQECARRRLNRPAT